MSHVATMETPRGPMVATQYYFIGELYGHNFIKTTNMSADRGGQPHKAHIKVIWPWRTTPQSPQYVNWLWRKTLNKPTICQMTVAHKIFFYMDHVGPKGHMVTWPSPGRRCPEIEPTVPIQALRPSNISLFEGKARMLWRFFLHGPCGP